MAKKSRIGILLLVFLCVGYCPAQGDANLLLQYNKGPTFEALYHPWNIRLHLLAIRMNTPLEFTRPRVSWGAGILAQHKINKTFGLASGLSFLNIHYRYQRDDLNSKDFLAYWRIPLLLRFHPNDRVAIEMGPTYNLLYHAYNSEIVRFEEVSKPPFILIYEFYSYAPNHFRNGFGVLASLSYRFWKSFALRLEYTHIRRSDDPFTDQSNTFRGLNLGLEWHLFNPAKHNKNDIR